MRLIDDLQAEHQLIEAMAGSLRRFVEERLVGRGEPADGAAFLRFFRRYAGDFHHAKEEETLFRALVEQAEVPADRGPIPALTREHHRLAGLLDRMQGLLSAPVLDPASGFHLRSLAVDYSHSLWHHIDAENSVMFPEGQERLRRFRIHELPSRPMSGAETAALESTQRLLEIYPPLPDPAVLRGDGCVACSSYGVDCEGVEHSWCTTLEWEDMRDRMASD